MDAERSFRRSMEQLVGTLTTMSKHNPNLAASMADALNSALHTLRREIEKGRTLEEAKQQAMDKMEKTYRIELKINFDDDTKHKDAMKLMRKAARTIIFQANLIADNRAPRISFEHDDFFEGGTMESLAEVDDDHG